MNIQHLRGYFIHDLGWGSGYQTEVVFRFLCDAANESRGGVVLDAGAGHLRYKPFFEDSIYIAQEHPIAGVQNKGLLEYDILSDIKKIPLRDNSVDLILSTSSLEHFEFPVDFFAESYRVLRPGGALYINVPFIAPEHEVPYDFQRLTRYGLNSYYTKAGFDRVSIIPTSSSIYTAQNYFQDLIKEDGKRLGQSFHVRVARKAFFICVKLICKITMVFFDKGPFENTTFPVGWAAKGYKKGASAAKIKYVSTKNFIDENAQCDNHTFLQNGRILSK